MSLLRKSNVAKRLSAPKPQGVASIILMRLSPAKRISKPFSS